MSEAMRTEALEIVRSAEGASAAIERQEWGVAERMLTETQERTGRLLREVGEKVHEALLVPTPKTDDGG